MIKAAYGESVYHMLRAVTAACAEIPEVIECNTRLDDVQIFEKVKYTSFIIPWCSIAYVSDPINNSFSIRERDGQLSLHSFDMQNTMPGNLRVKLSLYAATQEQIFALENTVVSFFTAPKELTIVDFPGFNGNFTAELCINSEEETQRKIFNSSTEGSSTQVFRTQINLIANHCVAPYLPISQERLDSDFPLQYHLVDRLHALNAIYRCYCQYLDSTVDFTEEQLKYIRQTLKNIPAAREKIKTALHIPEAYNNIEYSKFLRAVMENTQESVDISLKKIRHTRNPGNSLHPAVRKQLIRDVKKAMDIEQAIKEHTDTIGKLCALRFDMPPMPVMPQKEDFTNIESDPDALYGLYDDSDSEVQTIMGIRVAVPTQGPRLTKKGKELYSKAVSEYESQLHRYCTSALPEILKKKAEWESQRKECVETAELQLNEILRQKNPHYAEIGFLPQAFQNHKVLSLVHQNLINTDLSIQQILYNVELTGVRLGHIDALKIALDLSTRIAEVRRELDAVTAQVYTKKPDVPVKQEIPAPVYPQIKANVPFFTTEKMINGIFGSGNLFADHKKEVQAEEDRIRNSPEYRQQCAAIDEDHRKRVALAEEQYQANLKQYHEILLPRYEKGFAVWKQWQDGEISSLNAELNRLEKALTSHYETTKIVPTQYRRINALKYIHDVMSSSNYTIAQAIQNYDMAVQRQIERERLEEERRRAAWAAEERAERTTTESRNSSSNNSSSGSGIFDNAKRRAAEKAQRAREKSLWGTAMCPYGRKSDSGVGTIHCDIGCPLYHRCGGRR